MSLIRLNDILFEKSSVTFRKKHTYTSSSSGITGNLTIASRPSNRVRGDTKDFLPTPDGPFIGVDGVGSITDLFNDSANGYTSTGIVTAVVNGLKDSQLRSLRDIKKINVSSSFGIYGSNIYARTGELVVYPHKVNFDAGYNILPVTDESNQKNRVPQEIFATDNEGTISSDVQPVILGTEYLNFAPSVNNPIFSINFQDKLNDYPGSELFTTNNNDAGNLLRNVNTKKMITDTLMPYYASKYNNCDFTYTNYNTLNFCHTTDYPDDACLVYSGSFFPVTNEENTNFKDFTFSCWINPRYTTTSAEDEYNAGTILHVSSSIALSIVSGSSTDENGFLDGYRLMLQLSQSAESLPSSIDITGTETSKYYGNASLDYPNDMIYLTPDNTLQRNHWHYISVKWSPNNLNGSGSLRIDDSVTYFPIPSQSFGDANSMKNYQKTIIGNFFDGTDNQMDKFFSSNNAKLDSAPIDTSVSVDDMPIFNVAKSHPLNAEIHELRGFNKYVSNIREDRIRNVGLSGYKEDNVFFHVPVSFSRFVRGGQGGNRINSPFITSSYSTIDSNLYIGDSPNFNSDYQKYFGPNSPFNSYFSNGAGGKYINLENFVKNFASSGSIPNTDRSYFPMDDNGYSSPRLYNLSASLANLSVTNTATNTMDFTYSQGSIKKRNLMILPNDNGLFMPDYFYLKDEEIGQNRFSYRYKNDAGATDYSKISLRTILSKSEGNIPAVKGVNSSGPGLHLLTFPASQAVDTYDDSTRRNFPIAYISQDRDSNDVSIFSISSLYYGEKIHPGTFEISDMSITGSNEKISLNFKDDMRGSLYRSDAKTKHAKWASVGNIFYDEGICFIKSPHPPCFGKNHHEIKFKGEQTSHVLTVNVPAQRDKLIVSHNPSYLPVSASANEQDKDNDLVYITGVNIHDENLNVIMKATLAQPVVKRKTDEYMFKIKLDF
jgi:hypothetical protein